MSIWTYRDYAAYSSRAMGELVKVRRCIYCESELEYLLITQREYLAADAVTQEMARHVHVCNVCGWWTVNNVVFGNYDDQYSRGGFSRRMHGSAGSLRQLDLADIDTPLREIRSYLMAKSSAIDRIHPRLLEETVAAVFSDLGFRSRVTAYSNDGGIDVILDGPSDTTIGVQVKRWKDRIRAEQIRAFTGALLVNKLTAGIFVTTSSYQPGAEKTSKLAAECGLPIVLMDASRFYAALRITQRRAYSDDDVIRAPFKDAPMMLISYSNEEWNGWEVPE